MSCLSSKLGPADRLVKAKSYVKSYWRVWSVGGRVHPLPEIAGRQETAHKVLNWDGDIPLAPAQSPPPFLPDKFVKEKTILDE